MGEFFSSLMKATCLEDCIYYVLNDSECHSNCENCCSFDCETRPIERGDDASLEFFNCCLLKT